LKKSLFLIPFILNILACQHEELSYVQKINENNKESFLNKKQDSTFYQFNKIATNSRDSSKIAEAYSNMAIIQSDEGDYFGSIESALASLKHLDEYNQHDFDLFTSNYNELGLNNINLKNYDEAIKYFDLAIKYSDSERYKLALLNNKALAYRGKKDFLPAMQIYRDFISKSKSNKKTYARALTNLAITKWLHDSTYNAAPELMEALHIREPENDYWGRNSSYAHLASYFTKSHPDLALYYARKRYAVAKVLKSANDQIGALGKLIELGSTDSIKAHFNTYQQLNDSVQLARSAAKNQFALIRYEVEKSKADNLTLQKDNAEQAYEINRQRMLIFMIVFFSIILSVVGFYWYKKRRQHMALAAENAIRDSQLKTSKRVHDVVANGIYQVMTEIENLPDVDKDRILDRLDGLYGKSRDISYETDESLIKQQNFKDKISHMLQSFGTQSTKISIVGNEQRLWEGLNEQAKYEIEHILQELMINMKKHSQASHVAIRFEQERERTYIYYTDNGIGMPENFQPNNGLRNTENRIKSIDGRINFDTKVKKGLKIHISFPIS